MSKHWKYLKYIVRHKFWVFVAGRKLGVSLWRLLIHDWSKFIPCEWIPYARHFYGSYPPSTKAAIQCPGYFGPTQESVETAFDSAWLHHQKLNPHHWQYWILREDSGEMKVLPMPEKYLREMVSDWMGAGRAITGKWDAVNWYTKNRERIIIADSTREKVELLLSTHRGE